MDNRCEGTNMAYKFHLLGAFSQTLHGHWYFNIYMYVYNSKIYWHKYRKKKICLPNKESISSHRFERTNMGKKCVISMNCIKSS